MITIDKAAKRDHPTIVRIGKLSVGEAHRGSCPDNILDEYLEKNYNSEAIQKELSDERNIYHIISVDGEPAGFSKVVLNAAHPAIQPENVTKLDRIYLLKNFFDLKLGFQLLRFNIELAARNNQSGIWLYTWVGNTRAISFYQRNGFVIIGSHHFQVTPTHSNLNHHMLLNIS